MEQYIGIDLGGTNVRTAIVTKDGNILAMQKGESHAAEGARAVVNAIAGMVQAMPGWENCKAVGMCVPGPVDKRSNSMRMAANIPCLLNYPLAKVLSEKLGMPVLLGNDADVAGLAEARTGAGKGYELVVYVTLSTGIGGVVVWNGQILPGMHGYEGEVGSIIIDRNRKVISKRPAGSVEDWASGTAITRIAREAMPDTEIRHAGDVFHLAQSGEEKALAVTQTAIKDLAQMFQDLATIIDPDCFVLGGGMMKSADYFLPLLVDEYKKVAMADLREIPFYRAELEEPGVIGAAMLPVSHGM